MCYFFNTKKVIKNNFKKEKDQILELMMMNPLKFELNIDKYPQCMKEAYYFQCKADEIKLIGIKKLNKNDIFWYYLYIHSTILF
jgi:hypothetical protein